MGENMRFFQSSLYEIEADYTSHRINSFNSCYMSSIGFKLGDSASVFYQFMLLFVIKLLGCIDVCFG